MIRRLAVILALIISVYFGKAWISNILSRHDNKKQHPKPFQRHPIQADQTLQRPAVDDHLHIYDAKTKCKTCVQSVMVNYFNRQTFQGKKFDNKIYIPAEFLYSQFGWIGEFQNLNGQKVWTLSKRKARVVDPIGRYNYKGPFTLFSFYKVEKRERVKYIDGVSGVPISTQWSAAGYFYPTQICQFALSHYTRLLLNATKIKEYTLSDCKSSDIITIWKVTKPASLKCIHVNKLDKVVMKFKSNDGE